MENPMPFFSPSLIGQGKVNQLGGNYINGRPLNPSIRRQIVEYFLRGEKPCNISRRLKVSHGAVSKILARYNETGSIQPGQIGGTARTRKTIVQFSKEIIAMKDENPDIQAKEIRNMLIKNGLCTNNDAPTESSIARKLTAYKRERVAKSKKQQQKSSSSKIEFLPEPTNVDPEQQHQHQLKQEQRSPSISHSIEHILGASNSSQSNIAANNNTNTSRTSSTLSNDELYTDEDVEEEGEDSAIMSRNENRRNRTAFTSEQIKILEKCFDQQMYPTEAEKQQIIDATGLDLTRINTWFSNRRARVRKSCGISTDLPIPPSLNPQLPQSLSHLSFPIQLSSFSNITSSDLFPFINNHSVNSPVNSSPSSSSSSTVSSSTTTIPTTFPQLHPIFPFDPQTALLLLSKLQQQQQQQQQQLQNHNQKH